MRNFFKSTLYLIIFALSGILFQLSCSNSDSKRVETNTTTVLQNKLIYVLENTSGQTIWTCNYDGTNQTQVPIVLPTTVVFNLQNGNAEARISPDGQKIFFRVTIISSGENAIYSCNSDGTNVQQLILPTAPSIITFDLN